MKIIEFKKGFQLTGAIIIDESGITACAFRVSKTFETIKSAEKFLTDMGYEKLIKGG